jgi:hypothetical protein
MKESDLDSTAVSQIFAASLTARGKHSPSQTWLRKWKKDFWMKPLFSQMSQLSHGSNSLHTWLEGFCLSDGLANQSQWQENEKPQKTSDGCLTLSQMEFPLCDQECSSQKMSKDSSQQKCQTDQASSDTASRDWSGYITKLRQEYSARLKSAHRTSASGCLSWPTIRASEYKDVGPIGSKSHDHMLGKGYLCAVVTQDAANWPTPCAMEAEKAGLFDKGQMGQSLSAMANRGELSNWPTPDASNHRDGEVLRKDNNLEQGGFHGVSLHHAMTKYGQAAPANPSTDGNHPVSLQVKENWATPKAWATPRAGKTTDENPETWMKRQANGDVATMPLTAQVKMHQWATPRVGGQESAETRMARGKDLGLLGQVQLETWATPNSFCFQPPENTEQWTKRAEYQQTEKGVNLHKPIQSQVLHENEKLVGGMPPSAAKLNSRWVEMLMNLPLGWTSPSCPVSVILNWPKFVSGWLRLTTGQMNSDSLETVSLKQQQPELF